jgi:DNA (cytosine-5)-methyltransferase 1
MEQIRIIKEMRERDERDGRTDHDVFPRWMVWENVPGAFSSNGGEDFRAVLEETARVADRSAVIPRYEGGSWNTSGVLVGDGWSIAWRVHDAQFWGVPQRRRRICLVADFAGDTAPWIVFDLLRGGTSAVRPVAVVGHSGGESGSEVFFVGESLFGDFAPGGTAREGTAGDSAGGFEETGGSMNPWDTQSARIFSPDGVFHTLNSREKSGLDRSGVLAFSQNGSGDTSVHEKINAITTNQNPSGRGTAMIFGFQPQAGGKTTFGIEAEKAPTIGTTQKPAVYGARGNGDGRTVPTITGDHGNRVTDYTALCIGNGQTNNVAMTEVCNTLDTMHDQQAVISRSVVRRLTPLECERLQGYPDGWTDIGDWTDSKGKTRKTSDAARYRALGNSIALPWWRVMLSRLIRYCREGTMASLFDGIGGFPLCWNAAGGETLWSSEIESFCIAVTKKHFGDEDTGTEGDWRSYVKLGGD